MLWNSSVIHTVWFKKPFSYTDMKKRKRLFTNLKYFVYRIIVLGASAIKPIYGGAVTQNNPVIKKVEDETL